MVGLRFRISDCCTAGSDMRWLNRGADISTIIIYTYLTYYISTTYSSLASSTMAFIVGDWNAMASTRKHGERRIGGHGRGRRNMTGGLLVHFRGTLNLFLCNTAKPHGPDTEMTRPQVESSQSTTRYAVSFL